MKYMHCEIVIPETHTSKKCKHCASMDQSWRNKTEKEQFVKRKTNVHWVSYTAVMEHPNSKQPGVMVVPGKSYDSDYVFFRIRITQDNRELIPFMQSQHQQTFHLSCWRRLYFLFSCLIYLSCFFFIVLYNNTFGLCCGASDKCTGCRCCCEDRVDDPNEYVVRQRGLYCSQLVGAAIVKATGREGVPVDSPEVLYNFLSAYDCQGGIVHLHPRDDPPKELFYKPVQQTAAAATTTTKHWPAPPQQQQQNKTRRVEQPSVFNHHTDNDGTYTILINPSKI
jgi:hypothetical protein